ncbi:putative protein phosphatase 2C 53 isoform X2 [Wolffia australiana]
MACTVAAGGTSKASFNSIMAQDLFMAEAICSSASSSSSSSPSSLNFCKNRGASTARVCPKRKRPLRIAIPALQPLDLEQESDAGVDAIELECQRFSAFCKRGRTRKEMEDRCKASIGVPRNPHLAFFGVYDGHGGAAAAEFAAENLGKHVMAEVGKTTEEEERGRFENAVATGYLRTDDEFLKSQGEGGTCCVTAVISDDDLIVSNAGDCRAVICRNGEAQALTSDHRPARPDERARIESLGSVAVSRGIGDRHVKPWLTAEPETTVVKLRPDSEFLILASDGLWDNVSNQEAVDMARPSCVDSDGKVSLLGACKNLADLAVSRGSNDDVSVMIIKLRDFYCKVNNA